MSSRGELLHGVPRAPYPHNTKIQMTTQLYQNSIESLSVPELRTEISELIATRRSAASEIDYKALTAKIETAQAQIRAKIRTQARRTIRKWNTTPIVFGD